MHVPISLSCNSQKLETTQMSFSGWTVKLWYMHANYTQQYKGTNFWFLQPLRWILLREKVKSPHHKRFILWDSCNDTVIEIEVTWGLPGPVEREGGWYQGAARLCWWNSLGIDYSAGYRNLWLWEHLLELFIHRDVFKNNCRQKWQPRLFSGSRRSLHPPTVTFHLSFLSDPCLYFSTY